jgi:hypothetical protein
MHNLASILILALVTLSSCNNLSNRDESPSNSAKYEKLEQASWLLGRWENNSPDGNFSEVWERSNDSVFAGYSFVIIGKDTVSSETILLEQRGSSLFYVPTVSGQNNGQAVRFQLTTQTENQLVFENPAHDFPQTITYTRIAPDSLVAKISGLMNGKSHSRDFPMKRNR